MKDSRRELHNRIEREMRESRKRKKVKANKEQKKVHVRMKEEFLDQL